MAEQTFAEWLHAAMEEQGLKQVDLIRIASDHGVKLGKSQLSQYLSGKTVPRRDMLAFLEATLGKHDEPAPKPTPTPAPATTQEATPMRKFNKSSKLDNVSYDVRGPALDEAMRMEEEGIDILKLNIGNPAPFGFRTPDEVVQDMASQLRETEGYSDSRGLFSARKAIMQYDQLKGIPGVTMSDIYTGNGVSDLINLVMQAMIDTGDEVLVPSP
ncbi:MAG: aminotransferase class I/II-fold pyridoxal phosphate-dependent enzyme, partial [Atopobiaceae bacterium]|nr:aminotransferase class I/II-fold pyridoxal phosphate-dependent enzyme [Atopobiaceae bacterium]